MTLFHVLSLFCAAFVFCGLLWVLIRRSELIVRPSFIFLGFFWLQVQFASAINSSYIYAQLSTPWAYFVLVHLFPIAILVLLPFTFRQTALEVSAKIRGWSARTDLRTLVGRAIILSGATWLVFAGYLSLVPFRQTGLYALMFMPELADEYRELSMKLADLRWFNYVFSIMEKAIAPVAGAYTALIVVLLWARRRRALIAAAVLGLVAAALPTMIYGARGPAVMVFAAATFAVLMTRKRLASPWPFAAAFAVALIPAVAVMALKSGSFAPRVLLFQVGNVLDRVVGRTFCDNVSHVAYVQAAGFHGIGAIEKLAPILRVEPIDVLNKVGRRLHGECRSYGLSFLQFGQDPLAAAADEKAEKLKHEIADARFAASHPGTARKSETRAELERKRIELEQQLAELERRKAEAAADLERKRIELAVDLRETISAGASFVVLNYSMFGLWSVVPSLAFVLGLDLLLFAYRRMPADAALAAIGGSVVPITTLCFSLFTTVLASKGLLVVPLVAWLVTLVPNSWFTVAHWQAAVSIPTFQLARSLTLLPLTVSAFPGLRRLQMK